jgi:hypothetical protein
LEAASARKTRPRLAVAMIASGETRPEGSMGADQIADEGGQIQPEPGPLEVVEATQRSRSKLGKEQQKTRQPITCSLTIEGARITQTLRKAMT